MSVLQARLFGRAGSLALDMDFETRCSWTVLFGLSGAGKSTVLRATCGLTSLPEQQIVLDGIDLTRQPSHRRRIAMVAQHTALFPHMTARENVLFSLNARGELPRDQRSAHADRLLAQFHAGGVAGKTPRELSGGEQQRVAIARALASSPRLLLLDEAFTGLQSHLRADLVEEVKQWQRTSDVPVLSVTHDVAEALACADEVLRIANGRIIAQGRPGNVLADERDALLRQLAPRS